MATQIFVNLPVKDLDRSKEFFARLGYSFNPKFTDATAACMVISDDIYAMLLTEAKFKECSGRDARFIARPPHRTVRAAFPHTAPTLGV